MELCSLAAVVHVATSLVIGPPVIRAVLHDKYVYACGVAGSKPGVKWTFGGGELWLQKMDLSEGSSVTSLNHMFGIGGARNALLRWQLVDGKFHCVEYLSGSDSRYGIVRMAPLALIEWMNAYRNDADFRDRYQKYGKSREIGTYVGPGRSATHYLTQQRVYFDFWCREGNEFEVYLNEPHEGSRLTRHDVHPEPKIAGITPELPWNKAGEWKVDWEGPFYVTANGDDRFFFTDTGRVLMAPRNATAGTPLKEIWIGPKVDVLVHDSDAHTWYAFTKDQYFEVAEPIKPKPHKLAIRREWTSDKALQTAAPCGRLIRSLPAPRINERTWDDLAAPDSRAGQNAAWAMRNDPNKAVAILKERLKPVQSPAANELTPLIEDLGSESFAKREAAQKRLRDYGATIELSIREAVGAAVNPERKRRLNKLLTECQSISSRTPDEIRASRAVLVLERIASKEARAMLQEWARGAESAVLTREARRALKDLSP